MDVDMPEAPPTEVPRPRRDRKISSKWRWDIDPAALTDDAVATAFPHTSDLFAYHALPIARRKLGPQALKKEIRQDMQVLLDNMPEEEFEKWVDSSRKLHGGDRDMLFRPELGPSNDDQRLSRATPAPIDMRKRAKKSAKNATSGSGRSEGRVENADTPSNERTFIKREPSLRYGKVSRRRIGETSRRGDDCSETSIDRRTRLWAASQECRSSRWTSY
jgi:hypothetical protein